jgi:hypothetical protein
MKVNENEMKAAEKLRERERERNDMDEGPGN